MREALSRSVVISRIMKVGVECGSRDGSLKCAVGERRELGGALTSLARSPSLARRP